jgi:hypothetical protein
MATARLFQWWGVPDRPPNNPFPSCKKADGTHNVDPTPLLTHKIELHEAIIQLHCFVLGLGCLRLFFFRKIIWKYGIAPGIAIVVFRLFSMFEKTNEALFHI